MESRGQRHVKRQPNFNLLSELPDDLLLRVLAGLGSTNLCYACMTCKQLHQLEALHQEMLWCALAMARWELKHLRWPHPTGKTALNRSDDEYAPRWGGSRNTPWVPENTPWDPYSALDLAGWKHRFAYLRAHKSGTTRQAMARCLDAGFDFVLVLRCGSARLRSGSRQASTPCKLFIVKSEIVFVATGEDSWAETVGLPQGAVPTSFELHVRNYRCQPSQPSHPTPTYAPRVAETCVPCVAGVPTACRRPTQATLRGAAAVPGAATRGSTGCEALPRRAVHDQAAPVVGRRADGRHGPHGTRDGAREPHPLPPARLSLGAVLAGMGHAATL